MRYLFISIMLFTGAIELRAQELNSLEIVYDTIYTVKDTIYEKQEIIVYQQEEYYLDFSVGFSVSYAFNKILYYGDTCSNPIHSSLVGLSIPFQAYFKPWIIQSGILYQKLNTHFDLQYPTQLIQKEETFITDTLDIYYAVIQGDTIERYITQQRDTTILHTSIQIKDSSIVNSYSMVRVPLLVGYQYTKNKFSYALAAGVYFSYIMASSNNKLCSTTGIFNESILIHRNFFVSPAVHANISYDFGDFFDISIGMAYYNSYIHLKNNNIYNVNYQSLASNFSLNYHF